MEDINIIINLININIADNIVLQAVGEKNKQKKSKQCFVLIEITNKGKISDILIWTLNIL